MISVLSVLLCAVCTSAVFHAGNAVSKAVGNSTGACVLQNCEDQLTSCLAEPQCRKASLCDAKCNTNPDAESCNLLCELNYGYNSTQYKKLLQCLNDYTCLPQSPPDGTCLALDTQTIANLTSMDQVEGQWWIVRGLNCGQEGWPAGFDYFPCQYDNFYKGPNGEWFDKISYCGGTDSECTTPYLYTYANASIKSPGVMHHIYTDPPLKPQVEDWKVLSFPHPDWMLYIYCGDVPTGTYAGGSVVTRSTGNDRRAGAIPTWVEEEFRRVAKKFNFDYDDMCISDDSQCTN